MWRSDFYKNSGNGNLDDLAVVIPAYNEERTIRELVSRLVSLNVGYVVVVDDASSDRTLEELKGFNSNVKVLSCKRNRGKEGALKLGFKYVSQLGISKVLTLDGDLQHDPQYVGKFSKLLDHYDVVIGSRKGEMPVQRKFSNGTVRFIFRFFGGLDVGDIQSGYRGYRVKAVEKLGNDLSGKSGFLVDHNIIFHLLPARIAELKIPSVYNKARKSHIKKFDVLKLFFGSFKVAWHIRVKMLRLFGFSRP